MSFKIKRREYRERSQPEHRKHLGPLEKKKDYKIRAKNYQTKRKQIKILQEKAALRNPDEFYFKMIKTQRRDGVHQSLEEDKKYTPKQLLAMKSQDLSYINLKLAVEKGKKKKLEDNLHFISSAQPEEIRKRHHIFVDDEDEAANFDAQEYFGCPEEFLTRSYNRPTKEMLESGSFLANAESISPHTIEQIEKERKKAYSQLQQRAERVKQLSSFSDKAYKQKQNMRQSMTEKRKLDYYGEEGEKKPVKRARSK